MAHPYRLLVVDLDGTLLNPQSEISPVDAAALSRLTEAGFFLAVATGRRDESAWPYVQAIRPNVPSIFYNGSRILDVNDRRVLREWRLPAEPAARLVERAQNAGATLTAFYPGAIWVPVVDERVRRFLINWEQVQKLVREAPGGDLAAAIRAQADSPPLKLFFIGEPEQLDPIRAELGGAAYASDGQTPAGDGRYPGLYAVNSEPYFLEVLPAGVSKGSALEWLTAHLGIPMEQVVAVGDAPNDLEMVTRAGLGVAVGNATPDVRAVARYVAPTNAENAVAHVVERFFLSQLAA